MNEMVSAINLVTENNNEKSMEDVSLKNKIYL